MENFLHIFSHQQEGLYPMLTELDHTFNIEGIYEQLFYEFNKLSDTQKALYAPDDVLPGDYNYSSYNNANTNSVATYSNSSCQRVQYNMSGDEMAYKAAHGLTMLSHSGQRYGEQKQQARHASSSNGNGSVAAANWQTHNNQQTHHHQQQVVEQVLMQPGYNQQQQITVKRDENFGDTQRGQKRSIDNHHLVKREVRQEQKVIQHNATLNHNNQYVLKLQTPDFQNSVKADQRIQHAHRQQHHHQVKRHEHNPPVYKQFMNPPSKVNEALEELINWIKTTSGFWPPNRMLDWVEEEKKYKEGKPEGQRPIKTAYRRFGDHLDSANKERYTEDNAKNHGFLERKHRMKVWKSVEGTPIELLYRTLELLSLYTTIIARFMPSDGQPMAKMVKH